VSSDTELLARYVPFVQYDSLESYAADSVAVMTDCVPDGFPRGNTLSRRRGGGVLAAAAPADGGAKLDPALLHGGEYPDPIAQPVRDDDYLDAVGKRYVEDAREMHARPGNANQVYGAVRRDSEGSTWLQYWFFYYYNDRAMLGTGRHEGDWEVVQFRIGPGGEPDVATYSQHDGGQRCDWAEVEKEEGPEGPVAVVYAARGSHACYFRPGTHKATLFEYNDDKGPRVRPQLNLIKDNDPAWVAWPGHWGSTRHIFKLPFLPTYGSDSPPGPRRHGAWRDPLAFHEKVEAAEQLGPVAAVDQPPPAAPEIEARREDGRAVISYTLPPRAPGEPKPKRVLVSVDGHKDGRPPATFAFDAERGPTEVEVPIDLEDRTYTVRAAAAAKNGITSEAASAELPAPAG
jgi:hypothetical protein